MQKIKLILAALAVLLLSACGNRGWVYYEEAQTCYMKIQENCDKHYKKAIKAKPELPGVHSSYATWLLREGLEEEAKVEYEKEITQYPFAKEAILVATQSKQAPTAPEPAPVTETQSSETTNSTESINTVKGQD